ncbi:uncharacterized protein G2W53_004441 [Senna tora]|uniref:Uncharacterized protein n=1 Tax=Senna tora TaxID=362788 RepID=A0A834XF69_9FABA|nr:uncharacterized protein G2W53_004441 [Senna tora]
MALFNSFFPLRSGRHKCGRTSVTRNFVDVASLGLNHSVRHKRTLRFSRSQRTAEPAAELADDESQLWSQQPKEPIAEPTGNRVSCGAKRQRSQLRSQKATELVAEPTDDKAS